MPFHHFAHADELKRISYDFARLQETRDNVLLYESLRNIVHKTFFRENCICAIYGQIKIIMIKMFGVTWKLRYSNFEREM